MAPKKAGHFRQMTAEEQVARLQHRATALQQKQDLAWCTDKLKRYPVTVSPVKRLLENMLAGEEAAAAPGAAATTAATSGNLDGSPGGGSGGSKSRLALPASQQPLAVADGPGDEAVRPVLIRGRVALEDRDGDPGYQICRWR